MTAPVLPTLPIPAIAVVQLASIALVAIVTAGSRARRWLGMAIAFLDCAAPCFHPLHASAWRFLAGLTAVMVVVRALDLAVVKRDLSLRDRLVHMTVIVDSFRLEAVPKRFDRRLFGKSAAFVVPSIAGAALVLWVAPGMSGAPMWIVRWGGGLLLAYASSEVIYALGEGVWLAGGFAMPAPHVHPGLARSIREFWGARWNRIVGHWLEARFFRPLARRGQPGLGMLAAFFASAVLHAYLMLVALGPAGCLWWLGYFLLQGLAALVEGPLQVARWCPIPAHAWVVVFMVATSPLFIEPALQTLWPELPGAIPGLRG